MNNVNLNKSGEWPSDGLEKVDSCPICTCGSRNMLYKNLQDKIFYCAPGKWSLYRCEQCGTGYLDPRPTTDTIHLAYENYFTHQNADRVPQNLTRPFSRIFTNGYRNWRYGTNEKPSSRLGIIIKLLQPSRRASIDGEMRNLPRPWPGARLLDLGCGNGHFLKWAQDMGWQVVGVDPDPKAVAIARQQGLEVTIGDVDTLKNKDHFDFITLSHVIEHLHNPQLVLNKCYNLLKKNGTIWLETPNLGSLGHNLFNCNWRGLEPPRHLVIFTYHSLRLALKNARFNRIKVVHFRPQCNEMFRASREIAYKKKPQVQRSLSIKDRWQVWNAERIEATDPAQREFVTMIAKK